MNPQGHMDHFLFSTLLPEVALNPSKPLKTINVLLLFSWSCGGQECPDDFFQGHSQTANCLRSILSFYTAQKASKTPEICVFKVASNFGTFAPFFYLTPFEKDFLLQLIW